MIDRSDVIRLKMRFAEDDMTYYVKNTDVWGGEVDNYLGEVAQYEISNDRQAEQRMLYRDQVRC